MPFVRSWRGEFQNCLFRHTRSERKYSIYSLTGKEFCLLVENFGTVNLAQYGTIKGWEHSCGWIVCSLTSQSQNWPSLAVFSILGRRQHVRYRILGKAHSINSIWDSEGVRTTISVFLLQFYGKLLSSEVMKVWGSLCRESKCFSCFCQVTKISLVCVTGCSRFVILHTEQEGHLICTPPSLSRDVYAWLLLIHQRRGTALGGYLQV